MKIFLLGKKGQLGQELVTQAKKMGFSVSAYGHAELDVTDTERVNNELIKTNPDIVINASAYHVVADCETHPELAFAINAIAVKNLSVCCQQKGIKFITFSTDYVFDGKKGSTYLETDRPSPVQIYGLSKLAGEISCLNYNPNSVVIRTCGLYGGETGSKSKRGNFILNILKEAEKKKVLEVSSEQIVSPTYAADLAKATLELLKNKKIYGIYHLVNKGFCSWAELAEEVIKTRNLTVTIVPVDRNGGTIEIKRPLFSALKNTRAKKLGVKLPLWKDAVKRYIQSL